MDLSQKELKKVATDRYWNIKAKAIAVGLLILLNMLGLGILGLYVSGNFPLPPKVDTYILDGNVVEIQRGDAFLNGEKMDEVEKVNTDSNYPYRIVLGGIGLLIVAYSLCHYGKAHTFGRELVESWSSKDKLDGQ